MPYKCYPTKSGKYELRTEGTGKVHGTHDSLNKCVNQMKAMYANMPKAEKQAIAMKERMANME